jgi:type IV secretory pathway VirJ component
MSARHILLGLIAALGLVLAACAPARAEKNLPGGRYGEVHVSEPAGAMRGLVILISDRSGWSDIDRQAASLLTHHDMLVVGVDAARYADVLTGVTEACHNLVGDVEAISHQLQREQQSSTYFTPIVAGVGQGGALAEQVLSGAPSNTIAGAVSIDPAPTLDTRFHPCPPDPNDMRGPGLPGFWSIATTADLPTTTRTLVATLQHVGAKVGIREFASDTTEPEMLLALTQPHLGSRAPDEEDVSDLPLVGLPAAHPDGLLAIVISGDGGWRDLDKTIAHDLCNQGVSVVGVDSLRYFWRLKAPEQTAHDLARIIRTYSARWHARSIALIGYSFGADVLPFAYNRLPKAVRGQISMMSLLGFAPGADFEIRVTGCLGMPPSDNALPAYPEIAKMPSGLVQCFYGEKETDTLCPALAKLGVAVIRTSGGHHFGGDYEHLARVILDGWRRRITLG